jgi:hypothetical protein
MKDMKRFGMKGKLAPRRALMGVVLPDVAPLEADLTYLEHPVKILDQKDRVTRHKTIKFFKVQWSNHTEEEVTWESDDFLRSHHPDFALPWLGCV